MRVLLLAKLDDHDIIVKKFAQKYLKEKHEVHVLNVVALPSEIPLKMNGEVIDVCTEYNLSKYYAAKDEHQKQLDEAYGSFCTSCRALIGDPLSIVKWIVREEGIDLVISGGHLTSHKEDIFSSTFSTQLMQQLSVPYLSIKGDIDGEPEVTTIAVVREFVDPAKRNLEFVNILRKDTGAKVLLVKINTPGSHMAKEELDLKMKQFAELNELEGAEFVEISASDKEAAVKDLVGQYGVNLLTLGHIHRNGISSFLRGDLRTDVLNHVNVPIYMY